MQEKKIKSRAESRGWVGEVSVLKVGLLGKEHLSREMHTSTENR